MPLGGRKTPRIVILVARAVDWIVSVLFVPIAVLAALVSRLARRPVDVGLGPEPLINNIYHKRALERFGYTAETFVNQVFFITSDFDYRGDTAFPKLLFFLRAPWLYLRAIFRYRCLYIYFNGGPLMFKPLLWRIEPWLYQLAGIPVVVMPYGGDVQDMSRSKNLLFKHAMSMDYPRFRLTRRGVSDRVDLWTCRGSHVISGVEWVDYLYHWDTLMLGHFSIDTDACSFSPKPCTATEPLVVLHAPNHRVIKGTSYIVEAVEQLQAEGVRIELELLEGVPNQVVREAIRRADVVADQLVVGWYAMFAIEAMATGRPVLCYLRADLEELYETVGLVAPGEIPLVHCTPLSVKETLRSLALDRSQLEPLAQRGREFVEKHHSLESVGTVFDSINQRLGVHLAGEGSDC